MESIAKFPRSLFAALFVLAGAFAFAAQPATASQNGCWYEPGDEPACNICGYDCSDGQQCCTISVG